MLKVMVVELGTTPFVTVSVPAAAFAVVQVLLV